MPTVRLIAAGAVALVGALVLAPLGSADAAATSTLPAGFATYVRSDLSPEQWSLTATHAEAAWTKATGSGVVVAVIDSGVDASNPDLSGQFVAGAHLADDGVTIASGSATDQLGHGTHVAGIIAAKRDGHGITGIAPDAKIMPINVDSPFLTGTAVGNAIRWAVDHNAKVVNLSLGFSDMKLYDSDVTPICSAAAYAESHKVVVVAAAGNDGEGDNFPQAPAACGTVLSVTDLDSTMHVTSYSSFDGSVALAAPGDQIYSTVPSFVSTTDYAVMSGTSMASPFVAGVAALVLQQHPTWTPAQVRSRLESTAEDLGPTGFDPRYGYGAVDPAAAVGATAPPPAATPALTANAFGFGNHYDSAGNLVINETLVSWIPDPTATVTGYTVTAYTPSGTTVKTLPATAVRWEAPYTIGGYVVTAQTAAGPIVAPPVWYSLAEQTPPSSFQVKALQTVRATWNSKAGVVVSWTNPAANKGHADGVFIQLDGQIVGQHNGTMPTHLTIPAAHVPPGDLTVDVFVQSSVDGTIAASHTRLSARVPFSATGTRIGSSRYRVTLQLAPSWGRKACHSVHCNGVAVHVVSVGRTYGDYLDELGQAVVTVRNKAHLTKLTVRVVSVSSKYRKLDMTSLKVVLPPLKG
ncbi:MAG TPA: S8 family serine peptidase [Actinomycetes bacterium]|nr:S8 family serine peptidase [Actinomycetes bacterium]